MLPISVCMIAKNEEKYIDECLRRLSAYDWEIIIVDTGSTDHTVDIARKYTPNVFHFDWINDFSAARNYSISKASNDYILVVDCDEYLEKDEKTDDIIRHLTEQVEPTQVGMPEFLSPSEILPSTNGNSSQSTGTTEPADSSAATNSTQSTDFSLSSDTPPVIHDRIARFFHRKHTYYQGSIHEQLVSMHEKAPEMLLLPLTFYHEGYSTIAIKREKASRNIALLETELQSNPSGPYLLFQLGQTYFGLSDYEHALPYFETALTQDVNENEEYVQTLVESYGYCLLNTKQYARALELEGIYSVFSKRADFVFLMGLIYMNNALFDNAIEEFKKATTISRYSVEGTNSYKAYYNIGVIYECMGNITDAVKYYKKCGSYAPACDRLRLT